ncbi:MAG: primosomal protein N' [Anaerolineaceae bacterium]
MTQPRYARVTVNVPAVTGVFDYLIPEELSSAALPGCLVEVPFGAQEVQGIILELLETPEVSETRPIRCLLDPQRVLTSHQISLAREISRDNLAPLAACLTLMLPPGLSQMADTLYSLEKEPEGAGRTVETMAPIQQRILGLLQKRGPLRGRQLDAAIPRQEWRKAAKGLEKAGLVNARPVLPPPGIRPKFIRTAQLACPPWEVEAFADQIDALPKNRQPAARRRLGVLRFLVKAPWPVEAAWVYASTGASLPDLASLSDDGLVVFSEAEIWRDPLAETDHTPEPVPTLTADQQAALAEIMTMLAGGGQIPCLLKGVSGSGKTEIYMQAAARTLAAGRQVIILVPEISLTPQTVHRFLGRFPGQVGLIHSRLSPGERYDTWQRVRRGKINLVVGPRSALFSPFLNPGLIVLDECHDESYAQSDSSPRFNAVEAAIQLGKTCRAGVILGTATPPVDLYFRAVKEGWKIVNMDRRILGHRKAVQEHLNRQMYNGHTLSPNQTETGQVETDFLPPVTVVDMRSELKAGNRSIFSRALSEGLQAVLNNNQQAILYLNRRGSASYVFCRECGASLHCPRCDLALTWHADTKQLICHTCRYQRGMPAKCPECGSNQIRQYGAGTEKVEEEVNRLFPDARTLRWDADTSRLKGANELILSHFSNHRADILIGTQMIAKGLDLPLVTLVGAVLADVGLNFPDYRAGERTFQLLTQVAGRASRSSLGGRAIFQSFQPAHYAIQLASHHDFQGFYQMEIDYRRRLGYPPFNRLVRLEYRHLNAETAENAAQKMAGLLEHWLVEAKYTSTEMIGPAPCYFQRANSLYRWQILLKGPNPAKILQEKNLTDWRIEVDPMNVL